MATPSRSRSKPAKGPYASGTFACVLHLQSVRFPIPKAFRKGREDGWQGGREGGREEGERGLVKKDLAGLKTIFPS